MRSSLFVAIVGLVLVPAGTQAQEVRLAHLRGRVTTSLGIPLSLAEVAGLGAEPKTVMTDSGGRFQLRDLPAGRQLVRVRHVGYKARYFSAVLTPGDDREFSITLEAGAYELPEVEVTVKSAKPIEYAWTMKYDDFFRRQQVGLGKYIGREDIERKRPWRTSSILAGLPGVRLRFINSDVTQIWFSGCGQISVWIDGWKQRSSINGGAAAIGELVDRLTPAQVEMIEVYTGPAQMPAEFLDDSCAAIAIWTR